MRAKVTGYPSTPHGVNYGCFMGRGLRIISSGTPAKGEPGWPWEHVSVSTDTRCPTWEEMCWVKDRFWREDEAVIQFHQPQKEYVNVHPFTLHLWRNLEAEVPRPPAIFV